MKRSRHPHAAVDSRAGARRECDPLLAALRDDYLRGVGSGGECRLGSVVTLRIVSGWSKWFEGEGAGKKYPHRGGLVLEYRYEMPKVL
jgi:hypothetical protein